MAKVKAVVHDTAANAELAGDLMSLSLDWENAECAAHKLQLAVNEGLQIPTIARAIAAGRKLVGHFKHSKYPCYSRVKGATGAKGCSPKETKAGLSKHCLLYTSPSPRD